MVLDRWIALIFLIFTLAYGYASYTYPLLPFERNMAFLPNTMPMALSVIGAGLALILLFSRRPEQEDGDVLGGIDPARLKDYKIGQAAALIGAMVAYALLLRPVGFLAATLIFLMGASYILGERRWVVMLAAAIGGAGVVWLLVHQLLGIYLSPLPSFLASTGG